MMKTVVIGATSAIGAACVKVLEGELLLVGRNEERLELVARNAKVSGRIVETLAVDLSERGEVQSLMEELRAHDFEQVILAAGVLSEEDGGVEEWWSSIAVNFSAQCYLARCCFEKMKSGHVVFIGSVAGDRGRQSNAFYGAQKKAVEIFAEGLAHRAKVLQKSVAISVVKPGFVRSPMTKHLPDSILFSEPEVVAQAVMRVLRGGRSQVVYSPWWWQGILLVIKWLPRWVLYRTKL